jgi:CheY-like chemotaxis protein
MNVLLVDDDDAVADVLAGMLEDLGCQVAICDRVAAALAQLAAGPLPDLVLSDIRMPGGRSGLDLAVQAERDYPGLPVVLMTGFTDQTAHVAHRRLLLKPIAQAELAALLVTLRGGAGRGAAGQPD